MIKSVTLLGNRGLGVKPNVKNFTLFSEGFSNNKLKILLTIYLNPSKNSRNAWTSSLFLKSSIST